MDPCNSFRILDKVVPDQVEHLRNFFGRWKFVCKENFDEFLKGCGINFLLRKTASTLTPTEIIDVAQGGAKYYLKTETIVKSSLAEFSLGQEFTETTIDGRKMKTTFSMVVIMDESTGLEYYALLQFQIDSSGRQIRVLRFIRGDNQMQVIMTVDQTVGRALFELA